MGLLRIVKRGAEILLIGLSFRLHPIRQCRIFSRAWRLLKPRRLPGRDDLFDEEQFRRLEEHLVLSPGAGALIPGGGGLRKIRWLGSGRGKRGGVLGKQTVSLHIENKTLRRIFEPERQIALSWEIVKA